MRGWPGDPGLVGVADELERVGAPRVLREALRVQIELARARVEVDVLEDRPEAARRLEDVGLVHRGQADGLGVAAALEVEHPVVAPTVFVVADEPPLRVRRERRLAGARQPEEDDRVAGGADVDRRVHRQDPFVGQQVVHDREGALLDLAGVLGADDEDLHPLQVDEDGRLGPRALGGGVGLEGRDAHDREVRREPGEVGLGGATEQVPGEEAGPGRLRVHAQRAAMPGVGADVAVLGVQVALGAVRHEACPQALVVGLADGPVHRTPPDVVAGRRLLDDELVLRGPAGVLAGPNDERTVGGDEAFAVPDRVLVQLGARQVGADGPAQGRGRSGRGGGSHRCV